MGAETHPVTVGRSEAAGLPCPVSAPVSAGSGHRFPCGSTQQRRSDAGRRAGLRGRGGVRGRSRSDRGRSRLAARSVPSRAEPDADRSRAAAGAGVGAGRVRRRRAAPVPGLVVSVLCRSLRVGRQAAVFGAAVCVRDRQGRVGSVLSVMPVSPPSLFPAVRCARLHRPSALHLNSWGPWTSRVSGDLAADRCCMRRLVFQGGMACGPVPQSSCAPSLSVMRSGRGRGAVALRPYGRAAFGSYGVAGVPRSEHCRRPG
jgi:hypothetical protein